MNFIKKYKHGFVILIYGILYMLCFRYLETRNVSAYHLIHTRLDDMIPFCEYFIVPYLLWFPYQVIAILYFIFLNNNKLEYYQLIKNLCMGMTIFLFVSWVYPNGHLLRPDTFAHDNIFTSLVSTLYATDTPTNILPSIHVFNSLAVHMAITKCQRLRHHRGVKAASFALTALIIMSTMFLKQHSVVDVILGSTMAYAGYLFFYSRKAIDKVKQNTVVRSRS